jgi:two-component system, cell cycle sensor histidine kinase and response regulator CckA
VPGGAGALAAAERGAHTAVNPTYGFAKQSRGHIKIYSEPDHGTTVRLYLPRATTEASDEAWQEALESEAAVGDATILVVEDKPEVRQVVVRQLAELGYRVLEAENATAALVIIASEQHIDVLFTDVVMPGGKSGVELAVEANQQRPSLKVVFSSGFAEILNGNEKQIKALGPLLSKPYRKQDLARQISEVLQAQGAT